ncbi:MAG: hypothetical protein AAFR44_02260 [Pseudomonadota bacterium]
MKSLIDVMKSLLIGGIVFLLPFGIVIVVLGKLMALSSGIGKALHSTIFPGLDSQLVVLTISILILMLIALAAGAFARTEAGLKTFAWLEETILSRLPIYTVLRQMIADMSGGVELVGGDGREVKVVAVAFDDQTQLGFMVDTLQGGRHVVFLPGAPSALSGTVVIVEPERVSPTELTPTQVLNGMRRLGRGLNMIAARAAREEAG